MKPKLRRCLGIDIGTTSVKVAEIAADKASVRLVRLVQQEYPFPPGPMDDSRREAVSQVLKQLLKENKITTRQAVFCLPGQSVFIRRIKVPRTSEERLHRIVSYEARQQIPFALEQSIIEYQVFDYGNSAEVEVLLVAMKKEIIGEFMKLVTKTGLRASMISISSLALFNFHIFDSTPIEELRRILLAAQRGEALKKRDEEAEAAEGSESKKAAGFPFNLPFVENLLKKKKAIEPAEVLEASDEIPEYDPDVAAPDDVFEEVRAYVNVGGATFDLAIARLGAQRMLGFTRSVPWAGNDLNRQLQERLNLDSIEAAEEVKRQNTVIVVPGREDEAHGSGVDEAACETATSWADRLILELRKSFDYFISQPDGLPVDSIILTGGMSQMRNLAPYIEEKLGIPVEIREAALTEDLNFEDPGDRSRICPFAISTGLALGGVGLGALGIDFLPGEMKSIREFSKKNTEIALVLGAILGMIALGTQVGSNSMRDMEEWLSRNEGKIMAAAKTKMDVDRVKAEHEAVQKRFAALADGIGDRQFWLDFLADIEAAKPIDMVLTNVQLFADGRVEIRGESTVLESITRFVDQLKKMPEAVNPNSVSLSRLLPGISQLTQQNVTFFQIALTAQWKETRLLLSRIDREQPTPTPRPTPAQQMPQYGPRPGSSMTGGMEEALI